MWITRVSIGNPVFATMMMVALLVLGGFSYVRLNIDQYPDVSFPMVAVMTDYPGASPETVESEITRKIEEQVNTVSGVKTVTSTSAQGFSRIMIEFDLRTPAAVAAQDVRDKIALIRPLFRREVKEPKILRLNPSDQPIISVGLSSTSRSLRELTALANQVVIKQLESVRGVGQASLVGGVDREVQVFLRPAQLQALDIGVDQVIAALAKENQELPVGSITGERTETLVTVRGLIAEPLQFGQLIVAQRGGAPVRLADVADVVDGQAERQEAALVNGIPALSVDIVKVQGANTIQVADGVREALVELEQSVPPDVKLSVVRDLSIGIRNSVNDVKATLLEGTALTILIVFLFLGSWRSTVITGLTLPIALIGTFLALYALGFTLNVMTLMALSLSVGILIDDAIVVRENIVRHVALGAEHRRASLEATQEIGLAVLATTFTIVAVFLPVAFMGGIIGRFFYQFGITVSAAVLLSLFVSFTLDPMLSSVWPDPTLHGASRRGLVGSLLAVQERLLDGLHEGYQLALRWALGHRKSVLAIAAAAFFGSFGLVPLIGAEFVPEADLGESYISLTTPVGSSLEYTEAKARQVEGALREFPEVEATYVTINGQNANGKNKATVFVDLTDRHQRKRSQQALQRPFRERLASIGGVDISIGAPHGPSGGKTIQLGIQGSETEQLEKLSAALLEKLNKIPGIVDLETSLESARPALGVDIHRALAADLGVDVQAVGSTLRALVAGEAVSSWKAPDGESYDVTVRLPETERAQSADLEKIYLASSRPGPNGRLQMVPLRQVAEFVPSHSATEIDRKDLRREVNVTANVSGRPAGDVGRDIAEVIAATPLPPGYRYSVAGSNKDLAETAGYAAAALGLAVIFIYLILASQFGSFVQPVAIMMSLPLSLIGVFLALLIARSTLNIFSMIGFIMLMGLVTKNAILLVDFINHGLAQGKNLYDAVLEAGNVRLRPIFMTTAAMIFGMLPLALGLGEGGEQRAPMAHAVIGGLITSTLLTLVVVPVIYTYLHGMSGWVRRLWRRESSRASAPVPSPAPAPNPSRRDAPAYPFTSGS